MELTIENMLMKEIDIILNKFDTFISRELKKEIFQSSFSDLQSFAERDPSSKHDMLYILQSYKSYYAVMIYRIAHCLYQQGEKILARRLSEYAKLKSGIEIHPGARIGENFVLDHGIGTVIGETTIIGKRCYILQNVILGASHIAYNKDGQRHPKIGDDVEIGSFVKIYGCVTIGNGVKISPGAVIKNDIPDNSKIIVATNYQITQGKDSIYYTGYCSNENNVKLFFHGRSLLEFKKIEIFIENEKCIVTKIDMGLIEIEVGKELDLDNIEIYSSGNRLKINLGGREIRKCVNQ